MPLDLSNTIRRTVPPPSRRKRCEQIFDGEPYTLNDFIGQQLAVEQLIVAIDAAFADNRRRLDHVLLASGVQGIGKTLLAHTIAYEMQANLMEVSGSLKLEDMRGLLREMEDRDVLFWDEIHLATSGGKTKADWMLPLLSEGVLLTPYGRVEVPDITVIGATTDPGRLPLTLVSRFLIRPILTYYDLDEAVRIGEYMAEQMKVQVQTDVLTAVATAANRNPRDMRSILVALRDITQRSREATPDDLALALTWLGVTPDGLSRDAQDVLLVLLGANACTMSAETLQQVLHEPGPLRHVEQALIQKGYLEITGRGRRLTEAGIERASCLTKEV